MFTRKENRTKGNCAVYNIVFESDIELHPRAAIFRPLPRRRRRRRRFVRTGHIFALLHTIQYNIILLCTVRQFVKYGGTDCKQLLFELESV